MAATMTMFEPLFVLFLQDSHADNPLHVAGLAGNTPLWSLHYEALFYVLFLAWWRWPARWTGRSRPRWRGESSACSRSSASTRRC